MGSAIPLPPRAPSPEAKTSWRSWRLGLASLAVLEGRSQSLESTACRVVLTVFRKMFSSRAESTPCRRPLDPVPADADAERLTHPGHQCERRGRAVQLLRAGALQCWARLAGHPSGRARDAAD